MKEGQEGRKKGKVLQRDDRYVNYHGIQERKKKKKEKEKANSRKEDKAEK